MELYKSQIKGTSTTKLLWNLNNLGLIRYFVIYLKNM